MQYIKREAKIEEKRKERELRGYGAAVRKTGESKVKQTINS